MKEIMTDSMIERVGIVGKPSDWLIASVPADEVLNSLDGFNFTEISIEQLYKIYDSVLPSSTGALLKSFKIENSKIDLKELQKAEAFYIALKKLVEKHHLTALTIRCFDLLIEYQTTGCFALSRLNDEGIIAGCEGDIVSLIGMIIAVRKTKQTAWMANPSQIDIRKSELVLAHCTVPSCITKNVSLNTHFESGLGVGLNGIFNASEVTIFRLGGKKLNKKYVSTGKIIPQKYDPNLCRTQIRIKIDSTSELNNLLTSPLGNHLLVISGKHLNILDNFLNK